MAPKDVIYPILDRTLWYAVLFSLFWPEDTKCIKSNCFAALSFYHVFWCLLLHYDYLHKSNFTALCLRISPDWLILKLLYNCSNYSNRVNWAQNSLVTLRLETTRQAIAYPRCIHRTRQLLLSPTKTGEPGCLRVVFWYGSIKITLFREGCENLREKPTFQPGGGLHNIGVSFTST
jgi:hypothetical protein